MTQPAPNPLCTHVAAHAAARPDALAYAGEWGRISWREQHALVERIAGVLHALGLERGSRVAVLLPDGPHVHACLVAIERAGLVAMGIGPRAGAQEIEHLLRQSSARVWISRDVHADRSTASFIAELRGEGVALDHHVVIASEPTASPEISVDGTAPVGEAPPPAETARRPGEVSLLNSTSGTTGMPKCVVHDLDRWLAFHALAVPRGRLSPSDVFMSVVPAPFGFGLWTSHVSPTLLGVPCIVMERFDASAALDLIESHRVSVLTAVSTQFIMMIGALDEKPRDLSSLRVLFTGGEAVPYDQAAEFEERTGATVLQFYGSNETGAVSGTSLDDDRDLRFRTAGRVIPEMHVRLFDEAGRDVTSTGRGQPGCRGPTLSRGYDGPGSDAANAELIREDGWFLLGDIVTLEDDVLTVVGRTDDFIIRGGKNVSGPAVEAQVMQHPNVRLAAAVSMPDPVFGEKVCVYVELEPDQSLDLAALTGFLADRDVSKEWWPERLEIVDALPRGTGGKVAKARLRDDVRAKLDREAQGG